MRKDDLKQSIKTITIEIIIVLISVFLIGSYHDNQETKEEINYHFNQADLFYNKGQYEEAIGEYNKILELSYNKFPSEYAKSQSSRGDAYSFLSEVRDKEVNAQNAINACKEALKIYKIEEYPIEYADTQANLGHAYMHLSEVRE